MARYRVGIVGLTEIGAARLTGEGESASGTPRSHADAYACREDTELVAVCDLRPEAREEFDATWSDVWPNVKAYADHREMLAECQLDVLSVCTSDHAHADIVVDACRRGVRGIFCEKPIATTLVDADRMIAAAEAAGTVLSIDHTRRWRPTYLTAREVIRSDAIGPVRRVVATFGGPRAMLFRNGSHLIDTVLMLVESEPEWVFAELDEGFQNYCSYRGDGGRDPFGDPGASGYIHFRSGARAFINVSKGTSAGFSLQVYGETGWLSVSDRCGVSLHTDAGMEDVPVRPRALVDVAAGVQELMEKLDNPSLPLACPARTGRDVLRVILGFLRSQELGNARLALAELGP